MGVEEVGAEARWRPVVRRAWILGWLPQAVLAFAACGGAAWWGARTGTQGPTVTALPVLALLGVAASADAVAHILPNRLLGSASAWLMACGVVAVAARPVLAYDALRAVLCALVAGAISLLVALAPTGLGLGDVKLCAVIGLWLGWYGVSAFVLGLWVGVMVGGVAALALLISRRASRKDPMAYGPYLILGSFMAWPFAAL
ncbi:prepilin peptidase [Actinomyces marmotae]|uniref:prepilin peptidase n=1 Tax=Actinomyces marmotae TaxID=2737173 RepID=UPI00135ACC58|nr:A24 family peptidase [Actinomyces marmotae]